MAKKIHLTESMYFHFSAEAFNALNHSNYSYANPGAFGNSGLAYNGGAVSPYVNVSSANFMNAAAVLNNSGTADGFNRHVQLSARFVF